jgi:hypothetical protein
MSFDLKVHTIDSFGNILTAKPYRMHVSADKGALFERDGIMYYANGEIASKSVVSVEAKKRRSCGHKNEIRKGIR